MKPSIQDRVFEAMARPETYPDPPRSVSSRETHISRVFIAGQRVYKIKKALDLGFLDYTTLARRQQFCQEEVRLNRRLSQGVYLGVVPITADGERIAIAGTGQLVEVAVLMRRLTEARSFLRMLRAGSITDTHIRDLIDVLCRFFRQSATDASISAYGRSASIQRNCEENFDLLTYRADPLLKSTGLSRIRKAALSYLSRRRPLFEQRVAAGFIREGHGDLRTGHIYFDKGIQIIDGIEFAPRYRCGDVAADMAFLAMDLDAQGVPALTRSIVTGVAEGIDDPGMLALMPFYQCYRAMVRVKVTCLLRAQTGLRGGDGARAGRELARFLALAADYAARMTPPELWIVCGLPGSGKSTVAATLGGELALPVFSSDAIRKEIAGLAQNAAAVAPVDAGIYTAQMTATTYAAMMQRAEKALRAAGGAVMDATFSTAGQREMASRTAAACGAALTFIHCSAPPAILAGRLAARRDGASQSDARARHLPRLMARFEPLGAGAGRVDIDTTLPVSANLVRALSARFLPAETATLS